MPNRAHQPGCPCCTTGDCHIAAVVFACCNGELDGATVTATKGAFSASCITGPVWLGAGDIGLGSYCNVDIGAGGSGTYDVTVDSPLFPDPQSVTVTCPGSATLYFGDRFAPPLADNLYLTDESVSITLERGTFNHAYWYACGERSGTGVDLCGPYATPTYRTAPLPMYYSMGCVNGAINVSRLMYAWRTEDAYGNYVYTPLLCVLVRDVFTGVVSELNFDCTSPTPPYGFPAGPLYPYGGFGGQVVLVSQVSTPVVLGDDCAPLDAAFTWIHDPKGVFPDGGGTITA